MVGGLIGHVGKALSEVSEVGLMRAHATSTHGYNHNQPMPCTSNMQHTWCCIRTSRYNPDAYGRECRAFTGRPRQVHGKLSPINPSDDPWLIDIYDEQLHPIARLFEQDSWGRPFYPEDSPVLSACRGPQLSAMTPQRITTADKVEAPCRVSCS